MAPKIAAVSTVVNQRKHALLENGVVDRSEAEGLKRDVEEIARKLQMYLSIPDNEESDVSTSEEDTACTTCCKSVGVYETWSSINYTLERTYLWKQKEIYMFYHIPSIQFFVAGLIFLNFLISAVQYTVQSKESESLPSTIFYCFELFFGYAFLVELLINMYGAWWWNFWKSGWNIFDFVVVVISILSLYVDNLPGLAVLRLFRAFRVIRLFKRVEELNKIFSSVLNSLPPIFSAIGMLFLVMGIWAILGVDRWSAQYPYYFGSFPRGLLTLIQIMTMDSWSSGIARDIIYGEANQLFSWIYFISYLFIASIIMANVLVAILLEKFVEDPEEEEEEIDEVQRRFKYYDNKPDPGEKKGSGSALKAPKGAYDFTVAGNNRNDSSGGIELMSTPQKRRGTDDNESLDENVGFINPEAAKAMIERQMMNEVEKKPAQSSDGSTEEKLDRILEMLANLDNKVQTLESRMDVRIRDNQDDRSDV